MKDLRRLLFILFFFSGFTALVYEVVWARQLSLIFGVTTYAVSSILAIFFTGIALGSWLLGKWVDRGIDPLKTYGFLELGIGLCAFITPFLFKFNYPWIFLGLIIPTTLMGGTLPSLSRFWVRKETESGSGVGSLYFINTLGATLGAFLTGFFLIASLGVKETIFVAATVNLIIGGIVLYLSRMANPQIRSSSFEAESQTSLNSRVILFAFGTAGFAALSLEVLWTRVLILFFGGSVYAFAVVLTVFLTGIALGSAVVSKLLNYQAIKNYWLWFSAGTTALGMLVIFSLSLFEKIPFWLMTILRESKGSFGNVTFWEFALSFLIMIGPTFLMGALFPLGIKIYTRMPFLGRSVGRLYAINTVGGILGSLIAGFLIIPTVGTQKGIWLAGGLYLLIGGGVLFLTGVKKSVKILMSCFIVSLILIGYFLPIWDKHFLVSGPFANWRFFVQDSREQAEKRMKISELVYYKEGIEAVVAVKKSGEQIFMRINGKTDAATGLDMDTQILSGQLPMLLHPNPEDVLVVGLGSGITLGSVETHPLKSVEAVEIEPAVVEAARYFSKANYDALDDKRLKMIIADGRNYLLVTRKKYEVITSEPSNVWLSGNSKLFTKEYFELAKARLKKGGIFAHWIQLYNLKTEDLKIAIKTFQAVFPYTTVWDNLSSYDLLLVGSLEPVDLGNLEKKFSNEKIKADLSRINIGSSEQFLSYLALDNQGVGEFTQDARENTDNHPILEFSAPKSLYSATISKNIESLKDLRPEASGKYAEFRKHVTLGKMYFSRGDFDNALKEYRLALAEDPENRWLKQTLESLEK